MRYEYETAAQLPAGRRGDGRWADDWGPRRLLACPCRLMSLNKGISLFVPARADDELEIPRKLVSPPSLADAS